MNPQKVNFLCSHSFPTKRHEVSRMMVAIVRAYGLGRLRGFVGIGHFLFQRDVSDCWGFRFKETPGEGLWGCRV